MSSKSTGPGGFNPMLAPGLPEEARKAVGAAFDAMSAWRNDMMAASERGGERAFDKMSTAAKALGWPAQIVDSTQNQMQSITKMQIQMMDQMMDAWEAQIKSPNPMGTFPNEMMERLKSLPGMQAMGGFPGMPPMGAFPGMPPMPGMENLQGMMTNPMQFWMEMGQQWQKNWAQAMSFWANSANTPGGPGAGGKRSW